MKSWKGIGWLALALLLGLGGCARPSPVIETLDEASATSTASLPTATWQPTHTPIPTETPLPSATPTLLPTVTPLPTATPSPTWAWTQGRVVAPILLYHHIGEDGGSARYTVTPENFRAQMEALQSWGFTSITPSKLVEALVYGSALPARPVVITFDDGNLDVYSTAFPIMQEFGFIGGFYIVGNRLGADGYVGTAELLEMAAAGWEIGSHSMTHVDLTSDPALVREEILQSRLSLEAALGLPVRTFAYPFGLVNEFVTNQTADYGYTAGLGLGTFNEHWLGMQYYLSRREVRFEYDLEGFRGLVDP